MAQTFSTSVSGAVLHCPISTYTFAANTSAPFLTF